MDHTNQPILVLGATGRQGGAVAQHLLQQGWPVRALTRNPNSREAEALKQLGATVVEGDLDQLDSLQRAIDGCYGVFSVQNFWEHGLERERQQGERVADAALSAGIEHLVFASVARCREEGIPPYLANKGLVEAYIEATGLPYTHIRPGFFMDMLDHRSVREHRMVADALWIMQKRLLGRDGRLQMISCDDIGRVVADVFHNRHTGEAIELASCAESYADIRRWYRESDRPQPRWVPVAPLGLLRRLSQQLDAQIRFYADGGFNIDVDAARRRYPWLKTFREWVVSDAWVAATGVPKRLTLRQLLQRGARLGL